MAVAVVAAAWLVNHVLLLLPRYHLPSHTTNQYEEMNTPYIMTTVLSFALSSLVLLCHV